MKLVLRFSVSQKYIFFIIQIIFFNLYLVKSSFAQQIGIYQTFLLEVNNNNSYINPFDFEEIEIRGRFISPTEDTTMFFGYYAGDGEGGQNGNVWRMRFMPDEIGEWDYNYWWSDGTQGGEGSFQCIESGLKGKLIPEGKRWRYDRGGYEVPIMIPTRQ